MKRAIIWALTARKRKEVHHVSKRYIASIFKAKEKANQASSKKQVASESLNLQRTSCLA
jgi:hypothetical protein